MYGSVKMPFATHRFEKITPTTSLKARSFLKGCNSSHVVFANVVESKDRSNSD
jgi:hypothetical protein